MLCPGSGNSRRLHVYVLSFYKKSNAPFWFDAMASATLMLCTLAGGFARQKQAPRSQRQSEASPSGLAFGPAVTGFLLARSESIPCLRRRDRRVSVAQALASSRVPARPGIRIHSVRR